MIPWAQRKTKAATRHRHWKLRGARARGLTYQACAESVGLKDAKTAALHIRDECDCFPPIPGSDWEEKLRELTEEARCTSTR